DDVIHILLATDYWLLTTVHSSSSMFFRCNLFFVLFQAHQVIEGASGLDLDLDQPATAVRIFADGTRIIKKALIDFGNFAIDGGIKITDRFHRFDFAKALACEGMVADFVQ